MAFSLLNSWNLASISTFVIQKILFSLPVRNSFSLSAINPNRSMRLFKDSFYPTFSKYLSGFHSPAWTQLSGRTSLQQRRLLRCRSSLQEGFTKEKNKVKRAEIIYKVAESYRLTNDFKIRKSGMRKRLKPILKIRSHCSLWGCIESERKIRRSDRSVHKFSKASPGDPRGELGISSCQQAQKWKEINHPLSRRKMFLLLTQSILISERIILTKITDTSSTLQLVRNQWEKVMTEEQEKNFRIYLKRPLTKKKKGKWSSPKPLLEPINTGGMMEALPLTAKV